VIILHVPWPKTTTDAIRQLLLRERFAWEIFSGTPSAHVLGVGLVEDAGAAELHCTQLVEAILAVPLGKALGRLQQDPGISRSAETMLSRAVALYTQQPELQVVIAPAHSRLVIARQRRARGRQV
jgi:hypothetical protein